jgi:hypothetical protein
MAGYRLAPKAARARRNPWQRRRLAFNGASTPTFSASDSATATETAVVHREITASDAFTINTGPSSAQGGLAFLFTATTSTTESASVLASVGSFPIIASDSFTATDTSTPREVVVWHIISSDAFTAADYGLGLGGGPDPEPEPTTTTTTTATTRVRPRKQHDPPWRHRGANRLIP